MLDVVAPALRELLVTKWNEKYGNTHKWANDAELGNVLINGSPLQRYPIGIRLKLQGGGVSNERWDLDPFVKIGDSVSVSCMCDSKEHRESYKDSLVISSIAPFKLTLNGGKEWKAPANCNGALSCSKLPIPLQLNLRSGRSDPKIVRDLKSHGVVVDDPVELTCQCESGEHKDDYKG